MGGPHYWSTRFDRCSAEKDVADDPVGEVQGEQRKSMSAPESPGVEEVGGKGGHTDKHGKVPGEYVVVDEDAAAGEQDHAELPVTPNTTLPMTLLTPISGAPLRVGSTVKNMSSRVSTKVARVAPNTAPSMW